MAVNTRQNRQTNINRRNAYINGNTVTKEEFIRNLEEPSSYSPLRVHEGEQKRQKKMRMSFLYVLFLTGALAVTGYSLISYLKLQSDMTNIVDNIAIYETTLNNLTLANDDEYSKMVNAVDYDAIRKIAIEELGMVYASNDQIITYTRENSDYVRQLSDLSD